MQAAAATTHPSDRKAFADQLAEVRAMDAEGEYKKQLNDLEVEYQFVLLRSLDLFHKEMLRAQLPERLHTIKEKLCDTAKLCDTDHQLELEHQDMPPLSQEFLEAYAGYKRALLRELWAHRTLGWRVL